MDRITEDFSEKDSLSEWLEVSEASSESPFWCWSASNRPETFSSAILSGIFNRKISEPEQDIFNGDDDDDDDGDNFNDDDDDEDVADSFPSSSRLGDSLPKSINCCCFVVDFDGSSFLFKSNIGSFLLPNHLATVAHDGTRENGRNSNMRKFEQEGLKKVLTLEFRSKLKIKFSYEILKKKLNSSSLLSLNPLVTIISLPHWDSNLQPYPTFI